MGKVNWEKCRGISRMLLRNFSHDTFPFPIYSFLKSQDDVILMSYDEAERVTNFSKESIIKRATKSHEGSTIYRNGIYFILYNDDTKIVSSQRVRYTLAHELGHIMLEHFNSERTELSRKGLTNNEYRGLEAEANAFASELLSPVELIPTTWDYHKVSRVFDISYASAKIVLSKLTKFNWLYRNRPFHNPGEFSYTLKPDYSYSHPNLPIGISFYIDKILYAFCKNCNCEFSMYDSYKCSFCPICGHPLKKIFDQSHLFQFHEVEESKVIEYSYIELDENSKAIECPVCGAKSSNPEGSYCEICGNYLINRCSGYTEDDLQPDGYYDGYQPHGNDFTTNERMASCPNGQKLNGRDRYCPYCGCLSTFELEGFLPDYKEEKEEQIKKKNNIKAFPVVNENKVNPNSTSDDVSFDNLPF